jgi:hypothetical protein
MELVEDGIAERALVAFAEGEIGEDFRGATEDGGVAVDRGVAGAEADVVGSELAAEGEPFSLTRALTGQV